MAQAISLVARGSRGLSDFGVFYRTCRLLSTGMGGELYPRLDVVTTWPISLSPTGLAIFQPLCLLGPGAAAALWALFNLTLLGISLVVLRSLLSGRGDWDPEALFAWSAILYLVLSTASIQVGQFSVLFVACWILSLGFLARGRLLWASVFLAIPSAIKLYPVLMVAVPFSLIRTIRMGLKQALLIVACLLTMCLLVPALMYGSRASALNQSFWENVILSPEGQVAYMLTLRYSNQSLDAVLLRYLSYDPGFHEVYAGVPHFSFDRSHVLALANMGRALILLATVGIVWRWRRRSSSRTFRTFRSGDVVTMAALWSSTLYMMLPETKSRYAVYAFLGFLPLVQAALDRSARPARIWRWTEIAVCTVLILVLLPGSIQVYGVGLLGPLVLWLENINYTARDASWRRSLDVHASGM